MAPPAESKYTVESRICVMLMEVQKRIVAPYPAPEQLLQSLPLPMHAYHVWSMFVILLTDRQTKTIT